MLRTDHLLARRRSARPIGRRRPIGLLLTVALALVSAPAVSAVRNQCNVCPRTCPMHHADTSPHPAKASRLKCHAPPAASAHEHPPVKHARGPALGRATCGNHGIMPATVLPPMILPAVQPRVIVAVAETASPSDPTRCGRQADPPDTPPPIAVA
jgi:hypothetical protein